MQGEHAPKCSKPLQGISKEIISFTERPEYVRDGVTLKPILLLQTVVQYFAETIEPLCVLRKNFHDLSILHGTLLCYARSTVGC